MRQLQRYWPYAVVMAAPMVLLAPFLAGRQVLYWGTVEFQFYPWQQLVVEALRAGHLPLWNPWLGNGAPLLADYQSAVFYPPNWLALVLPLALAQAWLAALHLAWAGAGMVTLGRLLKYSTLGQVVAGLAFGLSQYLVARISFISINATVAWLPWIVCLVEYQVRLGEQGAGRRGRARAALWLASAGAAQLLAGHAQTTWYTGLLAAGWCGWRLLTPGAVSQRARISAALWIAAPMVVGGLLASVQLLPTAELLQQSPRATAAAFDFVMTYSFSPWRLLTLAAPDLLGNPARGQFFGYGNYWEDALYVGLLPLLLAVGVTLATVTDRLRQRSAATRPGPPGLVIFLVAVAGLSLLLGLGQNTPVFPFLYWHVPTFNLFQAPTRILIWLVFALALLAGLGVDAWRRPQGWALYWTRLGAAGAGGVTIVGLLAWVAISSATQTGVQMQTMGRALALAGFVGFGAALLSLARPRGESGWWVAAVVIFLTADLVYANDGLNPGAPTDLYRQPTASAQAIHAALGDHRLLYFGDDEYAVKYGRFVSFKTFGPSTLAAGGREALLANASALDGVASANNFEPLVSARYAGLMEVISATRSAPLLRLMDIAVIASPAQLDLERVAVSAPGGVTFYRAPSVPQRVWQLSQALTVAGPAEALAAMADPHFDPDKAVILEASDESRAAAAATFTPSAAATVIPVNLAQAGWVLLADTDYPGWVASVDGQTVSVRHGDYAFRAVAVPAGAHTVMFDYQPASLRNGWRLTAVGLLLVLLLMAGSLDWGRGRRRESRNG